MMSLASKQVVQASAQGRSAPAGVSMRCASLKPRTFGSVLPRAGGRSRVGGRASSPQIVCVGSVTQENFEAEVLKSPEPVLVDFWATWCGPCKLVAPLMDMVEKDYGGAIKVVKVEVDPNPELVEKYAVYGLPTLILFKDGQMAEGGKHEGAIGKKKLLTWLEEKHGLAKVEA